MKDQSHYYQNLRHFFVDYPNPCYSQIELDVKRTFPEDEFFQIPAVTRALKNVLVAYTRRNPRVGYCQGLNFVVG